MKSIQNHILDKLHSIPKEAIGLATSGVEITEIVFKTEADTQGKTGDCYLVNGVIHPADPKGFDIRFQIGLPAQWNGKIIQLGGGGLDGFVPDVTFIFPTGGAGMNAPSPLKKGYVVCGGDGGHALDPQNPNDVSWALNEESRRNYAHEALKKVHDVCVYLVERAFGEKPDKCYFAGGSNGGRECLKALENYPKDYDGAVCQYPVLYWVLKILLDVKNGKLIQDLGEDCVISPETYTEVYQTILRFHSKRHGDGKGLITDLAGATCDRALIRNELKGMLTEKQLAVLDAFTEPMRVPYPLGYGDVELPGYAVYEGAPMVDEILGNPWMCYYDTSGQSASGGVEAIKCAVMRDPDYDGWNYDLSVIGEKLADASKLIDAYGVMLDEFKAHGGKLLLVQGLCDELVTPYGTDQYFDRLTRYYGAEQRDSFLRYYRIPGYGHGVGRGYMIDRDFIEVLDNWVESGVAPEELSVPNMLDPSVVQIIKPE